MRYTTVIYEPESTTILKKGDSGCEQGYINGSYLAALAHIQKLPKKSICKAEKKKLYL